MPAQTISFIVCFIFNTFYAQEFYILIEILRNILVLIWIY